MRRSTSRRQISPMTLCPCSVWSASVEAVRNTGLPGTKPDLELARLKQIFLIGKAALPLHQILHIEAPVGSGVEDEAALHLHEQGRGNASYGLRQIPEGAESVSGRSAGFARVRSWALRKASKGFTRKTTGGVSGAVPRTSYLTSSKRCPGISINSA